MKKLDDMDFYKKIGNRIAHFRKIQNWSQAEFAQKLGVKQQVIANYEIARTRIPISFLVKVAEELYVDVGELLVLKNNKNKGSLLPKLKRCMDAMEHMPLEKQKLACDILISIIEN